MNQLWKNLKKESDHILSDGRDQNVARQDKSDAGFDIIN
jgi:hypothetical protein